MSSLTSRLISSNQQLFDISTRHRFLEQVGLNTIDSSKVARFLEQDRNFAFVYGRIAAILTGRVPVGNAERATGKERGSDEYIFRLLGSGVTNSIREIAFFETLSPLFSKPLNLSSPPSSACTNYTSYLIKVCSLPTDFREGLVAFWALERIYLEGWTYAASLSAEHLLEGKDGDVNPWRELLNNWTSVEFGEYVRSLANVVDSLSQEGDPFEEKANEVFNTVAKMEVDFWDMCVEDEPDAQAGLES
ncbi:heme oxygenase-like protein [Atractiella rhizophila]|nr:heme oxygenase-like protein [Atractiella rhizophila]KAH8923918.1 heme oxygenase-like protein [Atractiella rhizophila]